MARLDFLSTGYSIIDETLTRTSSTALRIGHDLILGTGFEIWTGANKTGTKLTITTDYVLNAEIAKYTTEVGSPVYSKLSIVNGTYLNTTLYITYTTVGDMGSVANVKEIAWPVYKTAAQWTSANTVLEKGQEGIESDTGKKKTGDGVTAWNSLAYDNDHVFSGTTKIYPKYFTATSSASTGGVVSFAHGLNASKIISVEGSLVNSGGQYHILNTPTFTASLVSTYWDGNNVYLLNGASNNQALSAACKILVWYTV